MEPNLFKTNFCVLWVYWDDLIQIKFLYLLNIEQKISYTIGSNEKNNIVINDNSIGKHHIALEFNNESIWII